MSVQRPDTVLPAATSVAHATDVLSALDVQAFSDIVDRDIRGNDRLQNGEEPLEQEYADALRTAALCERWYQTLVRMKKSTELTISAKGMDDKNTRHRLETRGDRGKADDVRYKHLQWRAGAVRFLTGVEMRLAEANYCRRAHYGRSLPDHIVEERDRLSEKVRLLLRAIRLHRDEQLSLDGDEHSDADEELWALLDDEERTTELN